MDTLPLVTVGLLGAYHGLNPAMGWLFAVGLGMQDRDRRSVLRALPPIAVGHEAAIAMVVDLVVGLGAITDPRPLHVAAAACLMCHRVGGQGVDYAPALDGFASRQTKEVVVTAIVNPSRRLT